MMRAPSKASDPIQLDDNRTDMLERSSQTSNESWHDAQQEPPYQDSSIESAQPMNSEESGSIHGSDTVMGGMAESETQQAAQEPDPATQHQTEDHPRHDSETATGVDHHGRPAGLFVPQAKSSSWLPQGVWTLVPVYGVVNGAKDQEPSHVNLMMRAFFSPAFDESLEQGQHYADLSNAWGSRVQTWR